MVDKEIPHRWYYRGEECEFLNPVVDMSKRMVVAVEIMQCGEFIRIDVDDDGNLPGMTYELIH